MSPQARWRWSARSSARSAATLPDAPGKLPRTRTTERMELKNRKRMMLFTGSANPELAQEVSDLLGVELGLVKRSVFANGEVYIRFEESVRGGGLLRHPEPLAPDQLSHHGAVDHARCSREGIGQADHRGGAILWIRPAGQEGPAARADNRPPHGRPVAFGRCRQDCVGRPPQRADPGVHPQADGSPHGAADLPRVHPLHGGWRAHDRFRRTAAA